MTLEEVAVLSLAAWRIAYHVTNEEGPWSITERIREWLAPTPPDGLLPRGSRAKLLACVYCLAFWSALLTLPAWHFAAPFVTLVAVWGGATAIDMIARRDG